MMKLINLVEDKNFLGHLKKSTINALSGNFDNIFKHDLSNKSKVDTGFNMLDPKTKKYRPVENGAELHYGMVNNLLDDVSLSKVNVGMFKTDNVPPYILDSLASDIVLSNKFNEQYGKFTHDLDSLRKELYRNGYSKEGAEAIVKKINPYLHSSFKDNADVTQKIEKRKLDNDRLKGHNDLLVQRIKELESMTQQQAVESISRAEKTTRVGKNAHATETANNVKLLRKVKADREAKAAEITIKVIGNISPTAKDKFDKAKPKLKSKFWLYLGGLSGLAAGGWYLWPKLSDGDVNDPQKSIGPKCLTDLLDETGSSVGYTKSGDPVIIHKKTGKPEFDDAGGLMFFNNNRVQLGITTKRGTWSCNGGSMTVSESIKDTVTRVLNEQYIKLNLLTEAVITPEELAKDVNNVVDYLDFPVYGNDLKNTYNTLLKYEYGTIEGQPAGQKFLELYKRTGISGFGIDTSLSTVLTTDARNAQLKAKIQDLVQSLSAGHITQPTGTSTGTNKGIDNFTINWDGENPATKETSPQQTSPQPKKSKINYRQCDTFPFGFGCINTKIGEIQECLGVKPAKGYFGYITLNHLKTKNGYDMKNGITEEMYNNIIAACKNKIETPAPATTPAPAPATTPAPAPAATIKARDEYEDISYTEFIDSM